MDIDRATRRQLDHRRWQNVTVRHDDVEISAECSEFLHECVAPRAFRLQHRQAFAECNVLDWRWCEHACAADGSVGLRDDADDIEPFAEQRLERRDGEVRGAPEENAHGLGVRRAQRTSVR